MSDVKLLTGQEIFDSIMGAIEPDLTSENAKKLNEKYAGEGRGEQKTRMLRYQKAFVEYDERYAEYKGRVHKAAKACKKTARKDAEVVSKAEDLQKQDALISHINSL